jgi:superfamily I DNA/RNA helicase
MAELEQVLTTDETREKTSSTTKKELPKRRKPRRKSGVERLQQAADRRVGKNSEELADLLTAKALKGKLANTRFLVGLAEGKKPSEKPNKKRRGPSRNGVSHRSRMRRICTRCGWTRSANRRVREGWGLNRD